MIAMEICLNGLKQKVRDSMERLTERSANSNMVWFKDRESDNILLEPCEMTAHHSRIAIEKLAAYEDAEEQGLLLRLPCGIGSDIYIIPSKVNFRLDLLSGLTEENRVFHQVVDRITFRKNGWYMECDADLEYGIGRILRDENYGVTWFLSKEEAEAKLKEMEDANVHECD